MESAAILIITLIAAALAAYPLLSKRPAGQSADGSSQSNEDRLSELLEKKQTIYSALKELEFDYRTGKISDDDYRQMIGGHKAEAVAILKAIEEAVKRSDFGDEIEKRVMELRRSSQAAKKAPVAWTCSSCGERLGAEDNFCSACGAKIARGCPRCGTDISEGDNFCRACGAKL